MYVLLFMLFGAVVVSAVLVLAWPARQTAPTRSKTFGKMPAWAQKGPIYAATYEQNKRAMAELNASGKQLDMVLFGDSITHYHQARPATFRKHFGSWNAKALGVPGNIVEHVAWRIMSGNERPVIDPKVIAFLIGINNAPRDFETSAGRLEELVAWLQRAYPSTKIVIMALLPENGGRNDYRSANKLLRDVARRRGVTFAECGQHMDPSDPRLYLPDGLHLRDAAYDVVLSCLKRVAQPFVDR